MTKNRRHGTVPPFSVMGCGMRAYELLEKDQDECLVCATSDVRDGTLVYVSDAACCMLKDESRLKKK